MTSFSPFSYHRGFAQISLLFLLLSHGTKVDADQNATGPSQPATATALLMQIAEKWNSVQTLQYEVDTKDTESDGFRKSINETGHDRDILRTHLTFQFKGANYGWKSDTLVEATGAHERVSIGGRTDGTLSILFQGPRSVLTFTQNPKFQSATPITGLNPVMEAYSFLISDDWQGFNCPEVDLKSLLTQDSWNNALKRITSFGIGAFHSKQCIKVVFGPAAGNHDVVYFSENLTEFPVDWQHYEGTFLRREVAIGDTVTAQALPGGGSLTLPNVVTRRDYYDASNPEVYCTSQQTLKLISVNQVIDDGDFVIDPSLADSIFDRDNDKRITVPK